MRDKFDAIGFNGWSDYEILEYMLYNVFRQGDTNPIAHNILDYGADSIVNVMQNTDDFTMSDNVKGIGENAVRFLRSLKEFIKYYKAEEIKYVPTVLNRRNIENIINVEGFKSDKEDILMICADIFLNVKSVTNITEQSGTAFANTSIDRIVKVATSNDAYYVLIVHNHPNGSTDISLDDISITQNVERILQSMGIFFIDHLVLGSTGFVSIKQYMANKAMKLRQAKDA